MGKHMSGYQVWNVPEGNFKINFPLVYTMSKPCAQDDTHLWCIRNFTFQELSGIADQPVFIGYGHQ